MTKDPSIIPIFVGALIINLIHQVYGYREDFKAISDKPGKAFSPIKIRHSYVIMRWLLTFLSLAFIVAAIIDFYNK